jgi:lysyl-tRNA synthetase class 2
MTHEQSEYEQERASKLDQIRELGFDPYGHRTQGLRSLAIVRSSYEPSMGHDGGPAVAVAGRIMLKRDMGKLSFLTLRDETGDLQVALDRRKLDDRCWKLRDLLDLGDILVVRGTLGCTNKGEVTVWADSIEPAAKALLPPPAKWEGLSDIEIRYRQRYVDLFANPEVMRMAHLRIRIIEEIRAFLRSSGFVEVETPMMQPLHGGAAARPFVTHHNALDMPLYLRIAPELYLKRLLVGGFSKVFELNRNFRNEGISPKHNPEFTMLEAYEAFGSFETMAELVERMICHVAESVLGTLVLEHKDQAGAVRSRIDLRGDVDRAPGQRWKRARMDDLVEQVTGIRPGREPLSSSQVAQLRASNRGKELKLDGSPAEQMVELYEKLVEPTLIDPCFVTHVPSVIIPLARRNPQDPFFCDVYELAINGQEISPGYTELNDPQVQREKLLEQVGDQAERQAIDEDFLTALKYGMPPAGGMGLGIDRLVMLLTGAPSIRDVVLFPLMRPLER